MVDAAVKIEGLKEFQRGLRSADKELAKGFTKVQKDIARYLAPKAQSTARNIGGPTGHFARFIAARGNKEGARLEVRNPDANAAFWGAKKRTGWNAKNQGRPNQPPWVGSNWEPGGGGGPYALNPTIASNLPQIVEMYNDGIGEMLRPAFPDGGSR